MRDEGSFRALFEAEYPRLVRELRVIAGGDRAEDIAADAFEQLARSWAKVREYERPGAWVRLVALRSAAKARRRDGQRVSVEASWQPTGGTPLLDLDLRRALAALTFHQRAAVALHHLGGYTAGEIAPMLGCDEATVRTHMFRGRRRLATLLEHGAMTEVICADD